MDQDNMLYAVITFIYGDVEYISACPKNWINIEQLTCLWPSNKKVERKAINLNMKPESDWTEVSVLRIIGHYANLKAALAVEKAKQYSSSSEAEPTGKRKTIKNKKYRDDSLSPPPRLRQNNDILENSVIEQAEKDRNNDDVIENSDTEQAEKDSNNDDIIENSDTEQAEKDCNNDDTKQAEQDRNNEPELQIQDLQRDTVSSPTLTISNCSDMTTFKNDFDQIIKSLIELKVLVSYCVKRVEAIENKLSVGPKEHKPTDKMVTDLLPLKELKALEDFEQQLNSSETMKQQLHKYMQYSGGSNDKDCINRCLEKVFTDYLAQFCSWTGRKNNFKLSGLSVMYIIKAAVKDIFPNTTDEQYERAVMVWFQHACTRIKRRSLKN